MLSETDGALVYQRQRRTVEIQKITAEDKYKALLAFNVKPEIAAAISVGLVTIKLTATA
jgi:hypothetical protein